MSVSYKAVLYSSPRFATDVRRFELPTTANFSQLQDKISQLFSLQKDGCCSITWKDEEGDMVSVSSDEELRLAVNCTPQPLRLYVQPQKRLNRTNTYQPQFRKEAARQKLSPCQEENVGRKKKCGNGPCNGTQATTPVWFQHWIQLMNGACNDIDLQDNEQHTCTTDTEMEVSALKPFEVVEGFIAELLNPRRSQQLHSEKPEPLSENIEDNHVSHVPKKTDESSRSKLESESNTSHTASDTSVNQTAPLSASETESCASSVKHGETSKPYTTKDKGESYLQPEGSDTFISQLQKIVHTLQRGPQVHPSSPSNREESSQVHKCPEVDPRIAVAVDQMKSMGFSDEGGWLTQLVQAQGGNIARVLDQLRPSAQ